MLCVRVSVRLHECLSGGGGGLDGWMDGRGGGACLPVCLSAGWLLRKPEGGQGRAGQGSGGEEGDDTPILSVVSVVV